MRTRALSVVKNLRHTICADDVTLWTKAGTVLKQREAIQDGLGKINLFFLENRIPSIDEEDIAHRRHLEKSSVVSAALQSLTYVARRRCANPRRDFQQRRIAHHLYAPDKKTLDTSAGHHQTGHREIAGSSAEKPPNTL